jgi:hypothetical protein
LRIENGEWRIISFPVKSQFIELKPSPGGRCPEGADEGIINTIKY